MPHNCRPLPVQQWQGDADDVSVVYPGEILVHFDDPASIGATCGAQAVACARWWTLGSSTTQAVVYIPDDFDVSDHEYSRKVIVHELLHALGIRGHVDSIEFPDSIMGTSGEYIPNLGHIISRIDREVRRVDGGLAAPRPPVAVGMRIAAHPPHRSGLGR